MGLELLCFKFMEWDSYDLGDWYNEVDFSYQIFVWNCGLLCQDKDGVNWLLIFWVIEGVGSRVNFMFVVIVYICDQVQELFRICIGSLLFCL